MALAIAVALAPAAAYAVNVSSNDGAGHQSVTDMYSDGWHATGDLKSTSGEAVYYSGRVIYNWYSDQNCGRYSSDTKSKTYVTRGGTCRGAGLGGADAAKFRVCSNQYLWPDECGDWSNKDS